MSTSSLVIPHFLYLQFPPVCNNSLILSPLATPPPFSSLVNASNGIHLQWSQWPHSERRSARLAHGVPRVGRATTTTNAIIIVSIVVVDAAIAIATLAAVGQRRTERLRLSRN